VVPRQAVHAARLAHQGGCVTSDEQLHCAALTAAMALAPGVYARNRMFDFHARAYVQMARARAAMLRSIARHVASASEISVEPMQPGAARAFRLRYVLMNARCIRSVHLSEVELATLRLLSDRAGSSAMACGDSDRACVAQALSALIASGPLDSPAVGAHMATFRDAVRDLARGVQDKPGDNDTTA